MDILKRIAKTLVVFTVIICLAFLLYGGSNYTQDAPFTLTMLGLIMGMLFVDIWYD